MLKLGLIHYVDKVNERVQSARHEFTIKQHAIESTWSTRRDSKQLRSGIDGARSRSFLRLQYVCGRRDEGALVDVPHPCLSNTLFIKHGIHTASYLLHGFFLLASRRKKAYREYNGISQPLEKTHFS